MRQRCLTLEAHLQQLQNEATQKQSQSDPEDVARIAALNAKVKVEKEKAKTEGKRADDEKKRADDSEERERLAAKSLQTVRKHPKWDDFFAVFPDDLKGCIQDIFKTT